MAQPFDDTRPDTRPAALDAGITRKRAWAWCTLLILLAMLGLTAVMLHSAGDWFAPGNDALMKWGGNSATTTLQGGNAWRLVASKLQLGSVIGLVAFIPFFWVVSGAFERTYGALSLLLSFVLVSALCSVTTLYFRDFATVSVGAGGPALGLGLCLLVAMLRKTQGAPGRRDLSILRGLALVPLLGLLGFAVAKGSADFSSLLCGLSCGAVMGMLLQPKAAQASAGRGRRLAAVAVSAAAVVAIAAGTLYAPRPPYYWSEVLALRQAARDYESQINPLNARFEAFMNKALDEDIPPKDLVPQMQAELIPAWRAIEQRWDAFTINPAMPDAPMLASMKQYPQSRRAFLEATFRGWATGDETAFIEAAKHKERLEQARLVLTAGSGAKASPQARKP
jgi:hypothetical protein